MAQNILSALADSNGYVTLALTAAGVVIPLAKAAIQKIEGLGSANVTITFTDLVAADQAELTAIVQEADADLAAVNAELTRLGLPAISAPAPPAGS
jgi:hypothetical protein